MAPPPAAASNKYAENLIIKMNTFRKAFAKEKERNGRLVDEVARMKNHLATMATAQSELTRYVYGLLVSVSVCVRACVCECVCECVMPPWRLPRVSSHGIWIIRDCVSV
jgi:hypothetical protein